MRGYLTESYRFAIIVGQVFQLDPIVRGDAAGVHLDDFLPPGRCIEMGYASMGTHELAEVCTSTTFCRRVAALK
ncbi:MULTISPECIES: hypothetical protein [unclassified Micromonospora]|uniref:hypothetical protein n=1 Tax=unclassified Micromonospora TaxID=2617518 RepID=UPI003634A653